jgi:xanthine dehydrogenase YagR molybdenum-binding subunit
LYASPAIAAAQHVVTVNQGEPTYMRAPGESPGMFALECAMDELAVALRMDPLAVRLANYAERDPTENKPFASKALRACYDQAASRFGWEKRSLAPGSTRDGRVLVGWGMATSVYPTNRHSASARVRLLPDGSAVVQSGTQDIGTGTYTIMTQVAADVLGLPMARVRAQLGDSRLPPAPVSGGSCTAASVLPAVQAAATAARKTLLTLAAELWRGAAPDALTLQDGVVSGPQGRATVADVLARHNRKSVDAEAETDLSDDAAQYSRHAFGAQFVEVRIDPDLGTIRVARVVSAFDCGRPINRKTVESQLYGGIVFGIGMALFEETRIDARTGRVLNQNISDYLMPVNLDVPAIEAFTVETEDMVSTPLGLKGVGELPMVGVAPAIANAVYHATGKRVRRLPIRIEDVI